MSYLCFKGRMMEKICFGWINNCQEKRACLLPKGYMCWKNQHQSYTDISSMTVIERVPFEGFIIKKHCSSMRYVNIERVINITWIWIHTGRESSTEIKCSQVCRLQTLNHVDILQFFFFYRKSYVDISKSHIFQIKPPIPFTNPRFEISEIPLSLAIKYSAQKIEHENHVIVLSSTYFILMFWKIRGT